MPTTTRRGRPVSPQPAAAPKPADEPTRVELDAQTAAWNALVERASTGDDLAAELVRDALKYERDRAQVLKLIGTNRSMLRDLDTLGKLDDDQIEFLDTFYPDKTRGNHRTDDDYTATRKAREAARKGGSGS